eukprot:gene11965-5366_t
MAAQSYFLLQFHSDGKCDESNPFGGDAIKANECMFYNNYQIYIRQNSTHGIRRNECDKNCRVCANTMQIKFGECIMGRYKYQFAPLPKIKETGFIGEFYGDKKCQTSHKRIRFVTEKQCLHNKVNHFNNKKQRAEIIDYEEHQCQGDVRKKQKYPLGKCAPYGEDDSVFLKITNKE